MEQRSWTAEPFGEKGLSMPSFHPDNNNIFADDTRHAGKVFVLKQNVLIAAGAKSSDGQNPSVLGDRFLLCLWDVTDGTSLWLELQSKGEYKIPHESKLLIEGTDDNWMDINKDTCYRDGSLWRLGGVNAPFKHSQKQKRAVTAAELVKIRSKISPASVRALLTVSTS